MTSEMLAVWILQQWQGVANQNLMRIILDLNKPRQITIEQKMIVTISTHCLMRFFKC